MKRIISLVLCLVFALSALAGCNGHTHTFASEWSSDAENHWHAASCEHTSEKSDLAAHTGTEDGICDVCGHITAYIVTVNAPELVTVEGTLSGAPGSDVIFKASVDEKYVLNVKGAEIVGEIEIKDAKAVYTLKVAAIKANTAVEISAIRTVYGEEIESGEGTIEIPAAFNNFGTVTFNAPKAGKYAVAIIDDSGVQFGENTEANEYDFENTYVVEVAEAGEVTVKSKIFAMSIPEDGEVVFEYVVLACDDVVLVGNEGTYTLPANVEMKVSYTAPVAGLYELSSSVENLIIDWDLKSTVAFAANEDGQTITFGIRLDDMTASTFEFDFKIVSFDNNKANEGENDVKLTYGKYYPVEFTAPKAGSYSITADKEAVMFYNWNSEYSFMQGVWGDYVSENIEAGDTLIFYVLATDSEATEETLDTKITIAHSGYLVKEENGAYKSQASAQGTLNVFNEAWEGTTYVLKAPEGFEISVDNGTTWANEISYTAEGGSIAYLVKGAGETADITIDEFEYKIDLTVGTTTVTMTAGIEYNVYVSGFTSNAMFKSIILSWNNENISGYAGWFPATNGGQIDNIMAGSAAATLILAGDADAEVTFVVEDVTSDDVGGGDIGGDVTPSGSALVLGDNAIYVTVEGYYCAGVEVHFTATEAGTYTLSAKAGENNAAVTYMKSEFSSEMVELPYEFTLEAGESINFIVATSAIMTLTEDTIDLVLTKN
ncbi:MAG: hypothetical protein E7626_03640 [Ruminococcaceae bacterium]|nr:hypothetical protein [Oscillospiraceae bacterium]